LVSSFTRSISLRIAFNACCMSCNALLFILLFSNSLSVPSAFLHLTSVSTPPQESAARKFTV
jgi:hypothetical protein